MEDALTKQLLKSCSFAHVRAVQCVHQANNLQFNGSAELKGRRRGRRRDRFFCDFEHRSQIDESNRPAIHEKRDSGIAIVTRWACQHKNLCHRGEKEQSTITRVALVIIPTIMHEFLFHTVLYVLCYLGAKLLVHFEARWRLCNGHMFAVTLSNLWI